MFENDYNFYVSDNTDLLEADLSPESSSLIEETDRILSNMDICDPGQELEMSAEAELW